MLTTARPFLPFFPALTAVLIRPVDSSRRSPHSNSSWQFTTAAAPDPVLICGAGPTGLSLAALLSQFGVPNIVFEKATALTDHPQAHFINNRTMEVFRSIGQLASRVHQSSPPLDEWRSFVYCEHMAGQLLGVVDHFPGQVAPRAPALSPEPLAHLPQNRLLPLLLQAALEAGGGQAAPEPSGGPTTVRMGCTVTGLTQDSKGITAHVQRHTGERSDVRGSYLVAADGAHSSIRQQLGIRMEGEQELQQLVNIHFRSRQLGACLKDLGRPGMLYFVFNADVVAVIVAHSLADGEFVAQVPFYPPMQSAADFPPDVCRQLVQAAAGEAVLHDLEIANVRTWTMSAQVAERYQQGRLLLAGDAAHRFPPAGGFGMNTGIQDAHNLAWKLAAVVKGMSREALLATYDAERRPVAWSNTRLSMRNWEEAVRVPVALGLDPKAASLLQRAVAAVPGPAGLKKALLEQGMALGRLMGGVRGPLAPLRRSALKDIFSSGQTLRLQFPKEDLGFQYQNGAVLAGGPCAAAAPSTARGTVPPLATASTAAAAPRAAAEAASDRTAPFVASAQPGCRLPHFPLQVVGEGAGVADGAVVSSLDVVSVHRPVLVLLAGSVGGARGVWAAAGAQVRDAGWPVEVVEVLAGDGQRHGAARLGRGLSSAGVSGSVPAGGETGPAMQAPRVGGGGYQRRGLGASQAWVCRDVEGRWGELAGVGACGALLVRPDGHVAWRSSAVPAVVHEAAEALRQVVTQVVWCLKGAT